MLVRLPVRAGLIVPELLPDGQVKVDMGQPILDGPKVPTTLAPTQGNTVVQRVSQRTIDAMPDHVPAGMGTRTTSARTASLRTRRCVPCVCQSYHAGARLGVLPPSCFLFSIFVWSLFPLCSHRILR